MIIAVAVGGRDEQPKDESVAAAAAKIEKDSSCDLNGSSR